jgi:hypothetical protein
MKKITTIIVFLFTVGMFAQERLDLKPFGFSVEIPKGWIKTENNEVYKNIDRFELTDLQLSEMLKELNAAKQFIALYKYDPHAYRGIIPTVNISIKSTQRKTFDSFKLYVDKSSEKIKEVLKNVVMGSPTVVEVNGTKAWHTACTYDFKDPTGTEVKLSSEMLYFYRGSYYITVNFIEEIGKEDNSAVFDAVLKTIVLTDVKLKK